jgi:PKD repeat protein
MYGDYIDVRPMPVAAFTFISREVDLGTSTADFENTSLFSDSYTWDFGDGSSNSNEFSPSHTYPSVDNGSYTVTLIAENSIGCADTVYRIVEMEGLTIYYIPNTFTPDGDDFNETFQPVFSSGYDYYDFHMAQVPGHSKQRQPAAPTRTRAWKKKVKRGGMEFLTIIVHFSTVEL